MMTSCSKDDYELPEVIESEVYDEGEAGEVRAAKSGTEGTQLSYESWIMVRGITRASFDRCKRQPGQYHQRRCRQQNRQRTF